MNDKSFALLIAVFARGLKGRRLALCIACNLLDCFALFSVNTVPRLPINTRNVKQATKYRLFFRIYLLKMSCGKRRKWHF